MTACFTQWHKHHSVNSYPKVNPRHHVLLRNVGAGLPLPRKGCVVVGKQILLMDSTGRLDGTTYDTVMEERQRGCVFQSLNQATCWLCGHENHFSEVLFH